MERPNEWSPGEHTLGAARDVLGGSDALGRALARWVADARVDDAARARARQHWLRIQSEEESSIGGVLLDLAERGRPVALDVGGRTLRIRLVGLGADFVAGRSDHGRDVLVRVASIDAFRAEPGAAAVVGDRAPRVELTFAAVMGPVATERHRVLVHTRGGPTVRGQLRAASMEVVQLRTEGDPPTATWIPLHAIDVVVLEP